MTGTLESDQAIWLAIIHKFTSSFTISNFLFLALQKRNKHFSTAWINPYHSFISRNKTPSWVATVHPSAKSAMSAAQALVSMATPFQVTERKRPQGERARENSFSETPNDLEKLVGLCVSNLLNPRRAGAGSVFPWVCALVSCSLEFCA